MNTEISVDIQRLLIQKGIDMPIKTTIADVVMQLYEKHGIWIVVNITITDKWYFELFNLKEKRNGEILPDDEYWFNSPKQAYEAAIEYCLTKLI